jgi:hypothetical protein
MALNKREGFGMDISTKFLQNVDFVGMSQITMSMF